MPFGKDNMKKSDPRKRKSVVQSGINKMRSEKPKPKPKPKKKK